MTGYFKAMRRFGGMSGRASRAEYWSFYLVVFLLLIAAAIFDNLFETGQTDQGVGIIFAVVWTVHLIPQIAVLVRRLHDTDRSGWWFWISLTGIGSLVLLVFACLGGTPGPNRFGPSPYGEAGASPGAASQGQQTAPRDVIAEVERLAELRAKGSLSDAEFEIMKARALNGRA